MTRARKSHNGNKLAGASATPPAIRIGTKPVSPKEFIRRFDSLASIFRSTQRAARASV